MLEEIMRKINETNKNVIVCGDSMCGKTDNISVPYLEKLINNNESFCVLDTKEEFISEFYDICKEKKYNISIINLNEPSKSDGFNPLEIPYKLYKSGEKDKAYNYLVEVAKAIFSEKNAIDPFWTNTASDFFIGLTLSLFEDGNSDEINLSSVFAMLNAGDGESNNSDIYTDYFNQIDKNSVAYKLASTTAYSPKETKGSIIATAKQKITKLSITDELSKMMSKTTIEFNDKPQGIFIIGKDGCLTINAIAIMLVMQIFRVLVENKERNMFNFIIDNFDTLEFVDGLVDTLGASKHKNISFLIVTRSLENIIETYGNYINKVAEIINVDEQLEVKQKKYKEINHEYKINDKFMIFDLKSKVESKNTSISIDEMIENIDEKLKKIKDEEQKILLDYIDNNKLIIKIKETNEIDICGILKIKINNMFNLFNELNNKSLLFNIVYTLEDEKDAYVYESLYRDFEIENTKINDDYPYIVKIVDCNLYCENPFIEFEVKFKN